MVVAVGSTFLGFLSFFPQYKLFKSWLIGKSTLCIGVCVSVSMVVCLVYLCVSWWWTAPPSSHTTTDRRNKRPAWPRTINGQVLWYNLTNVMYLIAVKSHFSLWCFIQLQDGSIKHIEQQPASCQFAHVAPGYELCLFEHSLSLWLPLKLGNWYLWFNASRSTDKNIHNHKRNMFLATGVHLLQAQ